MIRYYQIQVTNKVESEKDLPEIVDILYLKVEGKIDRGIHLSHVHPSRIETKKLEIKELSKDMYEHREQILERRLKSQ